MCTVIFYKRNELCFTVVQKLLFCNNVRSTVCVLYMGTVPINIPTCVSNSQ